MVSTRSTLRWARRRMAQVPEVPRPWDVHLFVERVAERRGRPIELVPLPIGGTSAALTGLWVQYEERDVVVYDTSGSELHRGNVVLHELAHMLAGHGGVEIAERSLATPASTYARVMHRSAYSDQQELEAEMLAFTIWQAAGVRVTRPGTDAERIVTSFEQW